MQRLILTCLMAMVLVACSCGRQDKKGETAGASPATKPVRVLVRERHSGVVAADGVLFIMSYTLAMTKDQEKQATELTSGAGLSVEPESHTEFRSPVDNKPFSSPANWKNDPKNFDFLLDWNMDWTEHSKTSMGQRLEVTVKENWKLEKVSDPAKNKSWSYTYDLKGPAQSISTTEEDEKAASEQIKTVIRPLREPVLKEIRSFMDANK